jgi:hypothetical protein
VASARAGTCMSGLEVAVVAGVVIIGGAIFACIALSYSEAKVPPTSVNAHVAEAESPTDQAPANHRQAA